MAITISFSIISCPAYIYIYIYIYKNTFSSVCYFVQQATHGFSGFLWVLFKAIILNPYHVLNSRLPEKRSTNYRLRPRAHQFNLPQKDDKNFLPRLLLTTFTINVHPN